MIDLQGRVALVTGSSRGIGRATAERLAEAGADVVVNYLTSREAAQETAQAIERLGRRAVTVKADMSEPEDVAAMMEFVAERLGRLDILVHNAAGGGFRSLLEATPKNFESTFNTNVRALLTLVQAAHSLLSKSPGRGKVVALSSHGSHRALPHYALIGASKAAMESLVRHMALELGPTGVNFNVVLAGLVSTDSTKHVPQAEVMFQANQARLLVGERELLPRDVADAVLYLASPLSDLVQGQVLVIDGGATLHG